MRIFGYRTAAFVFSALSAGFPLSARESLQFNRDVRPILSDHCYACHGPDERSREAELRLDKRESALGTNLIGAAIVPGKPELSELVFRIESDDEEELMPPPKLHNH